MLYKELLECKQWKLKMKKNKVYWIIHRLWRLIDKIWRNQMSKFEEKLYEHMKLREGYKNEVYLDTLDKPTCGIGHLLTA